MAELSARNVGLNPTRRHYLWYRDALKCLYVERCGIRFSIKFRKEQI